MARTKEFEPDQALEHAMNVFWRFGYENTSLDQLMGEMGIARQSLYNTFGDKRSLYLQALRHYRDENLARLRAMFAGDTSVRQSIATLLHELTSQTRDQRERGCLLLSATMERPADDKEVLEFLRDNQRTVERILAEALKRAQDRGEIPSTKDPRALASFFVSAIQGIRSVAKVEPDRKVLENVAAITLSSLE
jgi:TetR/AcrR family transcriptional regulator, transcriptional repressor for nem operon